MGRKNMVKKVGADAPSVMETVEPIIKPEDVKQFTLSEVAAELGCHRVTILRLEQSDKIPKATWVRRPQPHRVYSRSDIAVIRAYMMEKTSKVGRTFLDDEDPRLVP